MRHLTMILGIFIVFILSAFVPKTIYITTTTSISDDEKAGLIKMREEEKLAFEVYTFMDQKWDHQVFKNILQSENRHGDFVKGLLDKYDIKDPYIQTKGKYVNAEIQKLYKDLTTKGSQSLKDAFIVGAIIEDIDIADLDKLMASGTNKDLLEVYENLNRGSRNHMRAFSRQLDMMNVVYTPAYINKERYDSILNGVHEEGSYCQSSDAKCVSKNGKACGNKGGKSCAGNGGNKNSGQGMGSCKGSKGNKKGCCK
jgi:hypothetical protein